MEERGLIKPRVATGAPVKVVRKEPERYQEYLALAKEAGLENPEGRVIYILSREQNAGSFGSNEDVVQAMRAAKPTTAQTWLEHWEKGGSLKRLMPKAEEVKATSPTELTTESELDRLYTAAKTAGEKTFGDSNSGLIFGDIKLDNPPTRTPMNKIREVDPQDFEPTAKEEDSGLWPVVDDFEYVFFPSEPTKPALDVSGDAIRAATPAWYDKDGNIYLYQSDSGIRIITPEVPKPKAPTALGPAGSPRLGMTSSKPKVDILKALKVKVPPKP